MSQKFEKFGAEARIELVEWYGEPAIRKIRIPKSYREHGLDKKLRTRRTKEETEILSATKIADVDVPEVFFADPRSSEIIMEYVDGTLLKDIHERKTAKEVYTKLGTYAAKLHSNGIIHGDLTTKNVIHSSGRTVLLDFGLAFVSDRIEDMAEDVHLLKQAIKSAGSNQIRNFDYFLEGYGAESNGKHLDRIKKQILEIERRGRYARVD